MAEFGWSLLIVAAKVLLGSAVVMVSLKLIGRWLMRLASRTPSPTDDHLIRSVMRTAAPIGYLAVFWWGWRSLVAEVEVLNFGEGIDRFLEAVALFLAIVLIVRLLNRVLLILLDRSLRRLGRHNQLTLLQGLEPMIRSFVWILGLLVFLQNQGVQMGAIYASLAGAGIGVGLALKGPISNFLNYLTILFDEPFRIGHFICFEDVLGTVERVGIRSTAIRSLSGERIVISNEDLLSKVIQNYGDLPKRRVATTIGVLYQTPLETVKAIPGLVEAVIRSNPPAEFDRCHFTRFADSALEFEFVYFIPDSDIVLFLDMQQQINHGIMETFQQNNIDFAYPSQTLFLESTQTKGMEALAVG
ncbi:mechanosensitive ion channel family protein [Synechococcus sp. CS-205]|uniref:mechanosensitive ion channel family protein n=1 Tax=Synechococcus sp. CS-205 TaxID=2847984 RepID=UPI00223AC15C|nr:mechanosensitive ion channel family protein [Synechococcus sp. CS-205]MCT0249104.1 mechanosensitive ion channel family protein [Synechococcus sp. CS-205]